MFQSREELVVDYTSASERQDERSSRSACRSMTETGSGASGNRNERSMTERGSRNTSVSMNEKFASVSKIGKECVLEGAGEGLGASALVGTGASEVVGDGAWEGFDDSDEDGSYIPSCEEEETDDDMDA